MAAEPGLLITGGVGFVGSHFARAAVEAGRRVVLLDDLSGGAQPPLPIPPGATLHRGDIGDTALVTRLCREHAVEALVHFAGKIQVGESVRRPELYFDVNLVRSLALLQAVMACGVRQVVFSSSAAVYGVPGTVPIPETAATAPVNPYGCTKLALEWALHSYQVAHGLRWAALRYFNAAGAHPDGTLGEHHRPETHLLPLVLDAGLLRGPPLTVYGSDYPTADGTCVRDYIHVSDLARAHLLALARLGAGEVVGPLNLGTGHGYSVRAVLAAAAELLGRPVPHTLGPRRDGDPPALIAAPEQAQARLGFVAERSTLLQLLEDALRARR
jgi:UDP-glucose-4-epimerase GalE